MSFDDYIPCTTFVNGVSPWVEFVPSETCVEEVVEVTISTPPNTRPMTDKSLSVISHLRKFAWQSTAEISEATGYSTSEINDSVKSLFHSERLVRCEVDNPCSKRRRNFIYCLNYEHERNQ